jgi:hypothetical protein
MTRILNRFLTIGALPLLSACLAVGVVDLFRAHRNHDYGDAIAVVVIWFILIPALRFGRTESAQACPRVQNHPPDGAHIGDGIPLFYFFEVVPE